MEILEELKIERKLLETIINGFEASYDSNVLSPYHLNLCTQHRKSLLTHWNMVQMRIDDLESIK